MKVKRKVTIEFSHTKITLNNAKPQFCELCNAQSAFVNATEAKDLLNELEKSGDRRAVESLHFFQIPNGELMICVNSIFNRTAD